MQLLARHKMNSVYSWWVLSLASALQSISNVLFPRLFTAKRFTPPALRSINPSVNVLFPHLFTAKRFTPPALRSINPSVNVLFPHLFTAKRFKPPALRSINQSVKFFLLSVCSQQSSLDPQLHSLAPNIRQNSSHNYMSIIPHTTTCLFCASIKQALWYFAIK